MRGLVVISLLLASGCASQRAAYGGMAAGAGVVFAGALVINSAYDGDRTPCEGECIGSTRALLGIGIVAAGIALIGVAGKEAVRLEAPEDAERAAMLGERAQKLALERDCPLVEALGAEVRALRGGDQLYEEFVMRPNISGCLQRLERMRNQAAAWELTKQAAARARAGDCGVAAQNGPEVLELDRSFHDTVFLGDAAIFKCLQLAASQVIGVSTAPATKERPRTPLDALAATAVHRAHRGDCETVRVIATRVRDLDAAYYTNMLAADASIAACVSPRP